VVNVSGTGTITNVSGFTVTGADVGNRGGAVFYNGFSNLTGTAAANNFTFNATGSLSGLINGGGGGDTVDYSLVTAGVTATLGTDFTNLGAGTVIGDGSASDILVGNSLAAGTAWQLTGANDGVLSGITFTNFNTVRGGTGGTNTFTANGSYAGTVNLVTTNNTWNHTTGQKLTTGSVTGTGSLTVPGTAATALTISSADLNLPTLTSFTGHLIVGGTVAGGVDPFYTGVITVNTSTMTVTDAITSAGSVTLLAGEIFLNNNITVTNSTIGLGANGENGTSGNIDASNGPVTLSSLGATGTTAANGVLIADGNIESSENITLTFGGAEVDVAIGTGDEIQFSGVSTNSDNTTDPDFETAVAAGGNLANALFNAGVTTTFSINPASSLIGLETLAFIDVGLFEEELTLFGQIGTGIALALTQCEEQEGCAPSVGEDEMKHLIESLEGRLLELEKRLAEESDPKIRAELEELILGFNEELKDFQGYLKELQDFFAAEEGDEEDIDDEELGDDGFIGEDAASIDYLAKVLETVKARIEWLESLKGNPKERKRLTDATGIKLTQETLDTIIEAAKSEAAFIENQMKLLIEGTEAMLNGVNTPMFTAESRDYNSMQTLHYGDDLLSLDNTSARSLINIF
jgi:hypothetical protein